MSNAEFESKRKAILKKLSQISRDKVIQRKADTWKQKSIQKEFQKQHQEASTRLRVTEVVVFGKESFFLKGFVQSLKTKVTITSFNDPEKAIAFCEEKGIECVLLDMDEPTDWKQATDIYSAVKTINPQAMFILLTSDTTSSHVQSLLAQGAAVITKPVSFSDLFFLLQ